MVTITVMAIPYAIVLHNLKDSLHITGPTPVQKQVIPAVLNNRDVLVSASTGSGKSKTLMYQALVSASLLCVCIHVALSFLCSSLLPVAVGGEELVAEQ